MKAKLILLLSILLIAGLSMVSCQKKETATHEKDATETTGYGEKAGEIVEQVKDAAAGYGEKAEEVVETVKDAAAGYGEKAEEVIETTKDAAAEYGEKAGEALEGFGK